MGAPSAVYSASRRGPWKEGDHAVGIFVHLDGHLDEVMAVQLLGDLQHPPFVAHAIVAPGIRGFQSSFWLP
jgi:hypothetical protein